MSFSDYAEYDGLGLADLIARKEVSPVEVLEACIARIEALNPRLNAVVYKGYDDARRSLVGGAARGPFSGVPFLIKDLGLEVQGWPRTSASHFASVDADARDSELVSRYRASGVVLVGKTNTPEFGIPGVTQSERLGPCRNPWNPEHVSGGSSGGAAAAVASRMTPLAHASDGLGSIRIPAACCGLVGLKTTRDRNPNGPDDFDRAIGFVVDHVVSRTVRDSAAMLDATGYPEPASPYAAPFKERPYLEEIAREPGRLRVAFSSATASGRPVHPEIRAALEGVARLLENLGHHVEERDLDVDQRALYKAQGRISAANFAAAMTRWAALKGREPDDDIGPLARRAYEAGKRVTGIDAVRGFQDLRVLNRRIMSLFETIDVFLTPVLGTPVPRIDALDPLSGDLKAFDRGQAETFPFTPPFNFTGQPSLSLPLAHSKDGLPIGLMFTGRYADEGLLFRLAGQLERAAPWEGRRPAMAA